MSSQGNTPPPPSTIAPSATASSELSMKSGSAGGSKLFRRYNQGGRKYGSDQSFVRTKEDDLNFFGSKEDYGVVVG